ncbi:hypothetical protein CLAC_05705 [Corynebacterium lactis RW2-5]|uniref:Uncharacterized protein n=1 Tax=Corynebacterium lactis RW2-5 TaxID=1408189 RepID=A0A0K2H390_9CORY|nr:hypothetical protein CLAC_05705 [Corynebacterium lactis RW2-5]
MEGDYLTIVASSEAKLAEAFEVLLRYLWVIAEGGFGIGRETESA